MQNINAVMLELNPLIIPTKTDYLISQFKYQPMQKLVPKGPICITAIVIYIMFPTTQTPTRTRKHRSNVS